MWDCGVPKTITSMPSLRARSDPEQVPKTCVYMYIYRERDIYRERENVVAITVHFVTLCEHLEMSWLAQDFGLTFGVLDIEDQARPQRKTQGMGKTYSIVF